jgi:hypothetical protein
MATYNLRLNQASLNGEGIRTAHRAVTRVTRGTFNRSQVLCPVDTGNLRATGQSNVQTSGLMVNGEVKYTARYAAAVHEGRRALVIRAKRSGRLREVRQPARAGRPFLRTALMEVAAQEGFTVSTR